MFRSAASLLAKKTAIIAITGVTVIGGATLALAVEGDPPSEDPTIVEESILTEADCTEGTVLDSDANTCDPILTDADCTEGTILDSDANACEPVAPEEPTTCTDDDGNTIDCPVAPEEPTTCTDDDGNTIDCPTEPELEDGTAGVHPENHGKYVSEAAKGGGECAGLTGRDKGQCVAGVARSDIGKTPAPAREEPAAAPAEEPAVQEPVVDDSTDEPAAHATTAPAKAEKPGKGNGGKGKGKGKKG